MESNENKDVDLNNEADIENAPKGDDKSAPGDDKAKETPKLERTREEQLDYHEGRAKRLRKELGVDDEVKKATPKKSKSDEFDEGQLAFLVAKGIESDEDIDWTQTELKQHGGTLRELLGNKYFQGELKARKEALAVLDATPKGNKRGSTPPNDSVDYHYAKYMQTNKLPADREMAQKVVDMRYKKETKENRFADMPIVGVNS